MRTEQLNYTQQNTEQAKQKTLEGCDPKFFRMSTHEIKDDNWSISIA